MLEPEAETEGEREERRRSLPSVINNCEGTVALLIMVPGEYPGLRGPN